MEELIDTLLEFEFSVLEKISFGIKKKLLQ